MTETRKVTVRIAGDRSLAAVRDLDEEVTYLHDLLSHATEFTFKPDYGALNDEFPYDDPEQQDAIVLDWRGPAEKGGDPDRWAVKWQHDRCWSRSQQTFVYEPGGGNRSDEFIADTRFSLEEAVALVPGMLAQIEAVRIPQIREQVAKWAAKETDQC